MLMPMEEAIITDIRNAYRNKISQCGSRASNLSNSSKQIPTLLKQNEKINFNESMLENYNSKDKDCDTDE